MPRPNRSKSAQPDDAKAAALRDQGALHPHPEVVEDEAFRSHEFFDPRDLVQVRYEMLRRHRVDGRAVTEVAGTFGVSRQAFYKTDSTYKTQGVGGLLPRRRGPKRAHKCTDEILDFVEQWHATESTDVRETVVQAVQSRFGVTINPRSIERALARRKKKTTSEAGGKAVRSFSMDATYLFDQYESLRKEAFEVSSAARGGHGLALFLSRGTKAWLGALAAFTPMASPEVFKETVSHNKPDLPPAVRPDLTLVLADMVLACYQEAIR